MNTRSTRKRELTKLYEYFGTDEHTPSISSVPPTDIGENQFWVYESTGKKPAEPDPYFTKLVFGKSRFNLERTSLMKAFFTDRWFGWVADWYASPQHRWVLPHLYDWLPIPLPNESWLTDPTVEDLPEDFIRNGAQPQ